MWQGQMYLTELQMGIYFTTWRDFSKNMELEKWYLIAFWLAMFQISIKKWIFLVFLETSKKNLFPRQFVQSSGENNFKDK